MAKKKERMGVVGSKLKDKLTKKDKMPTFPMETGAMNSGKAGVFSEKKSKSAGKDIVKSAKKASPGVKVKAIAKSGAGIPKKKFKKK